MEYVGIGYTDASIGHWATAAGCGRQRQRALDQDVCAALVRAFVDTAPAYGQGRSENRGPRCGAGHRDRVVLATKVDEWGANGIRSATRAGAVNREIPGF
jgi:aryl-alcohol dehydrogenase-like predicted oxidoreductase